MAGESGWWKVDGGKWAVESGQWKVDSEGMKPKRDCCET